jgi:hypothetical protein
MDNPNERGLHTSASAAEADSLCAGRHLFQREMPDVKSEDAEAGTNVHDALGKGSPDGLDLEGQELYDRCQGIEKEVVARYFGLDAPPPPEREKRLWIAWTQTTGGLQHSGQPDALYRCKARALIIDYKTGRNETPASPSNMQLRDLAVLGWANKPLLNEIAVAIIQPWVTSKPEICVYKADDIKKASQLLLARVQASNDKSAPRVAGELQCKYCRARSKCPEYQKFATAIVPMGDRSIVDIPVDDWTPQQCAVFLGSLGRAEKWLEECKSKMKALIKANPSAVPGWTLKPGVVRESITDAQTVFNRFSELGGSLEQFMGCITIGKAKVKEQVAGVTKTKGKALEAVMDGLTAGCVEAKESEPSLKKVGA